MGTVNQQEWNTEVSEIDAKRGILSNPANNLSCTHYKENLMKTESIKLNELLEQSRTRLLKLSESQVSAKPYDEKWSLKEILGHLIDSAGNNHQRFVRMQEKRDIGTFIYSQQHWVSAQRYQNEPWNALVETWYHINKHLAHVIEHIDPATLTNTCDVGDPQPATLQSIVTGYLRHVQHHIDQIFSDADPRQRSNWKQV